MRPWLRWELDYALANKDRLKYAGIGRRLGRSARSVASALERYGRAGHYQRRAAWEPTLRELHARGLVDTEIASETGVGRATVQRRRALLGLEPNPYTGHRERYERQMHNADANNLVDLRWRPLRVAALLSGSASTNRTGSG